MYIQAVQRKWAPVITNYRYQQQTHNLFLEFKAGFQTSSSEDEDMARYAKYNREVDNLWIRTYFIGKIPEEQNEILADIEKVIEVAQSNPLSLQDDDARQDLETDIRLVIRMRNHLKKESIPPGG